MGSKGPREVGDPLCQGTPGFCLGLATKEIGERKFPRGAWPPFSLLRGTKTFHLLRLCLLPDTCWAPDLRVIIHAIHPAPVREGHWPYLTDGKTGSGKSGPLSKVTQPVNGRADLKPPSPVTATGLTRTFVCLKSQLTGGEESQTGVCLFLARSKKTFQTPQTLEGLPVRPPGSAVCRTQCPVLLKPRTTWPLMVLPGYISCQCP